MSGIGGLGWAYPIQPSGGGGGAALPLPATYLPQPTGAASTSGGGGLLGGLDIKSLLGGLDFSKLLGGLAPPTPPPLPDIMGQLGPLFAQLGAQFKNFNAFPQLPPDVENLLTTISNQRAATAYDNQRAQLFGSGLERSTEGNRENAVLTANLTAQQAQEELAARSQMADKLLAAMTGQGSLLGEQGNLMLGQGNLANSQFGTVANLFANELQAKLSALGLGTNLIQGLLGPLLSSIFSKLPGFGGALGGGGGTPSLFSNSLGGGGLGFGGGGLGFEGATQPSTTTTPSSNNPGTFQYPSPGPLTPTYTYTAGVTPGPAPAGVGGGPNALAYRTGELPPPSYISPAMFQQLIFQWLAQFLQQLNGII